MRPGEMCPQTATSWVYRLEQKRVCRGCVVQRWATCRGPLGAHVLLGAVVGRLGGETAAVLWWLVVWKGLVQPRSGSFHLLSEEKYRLTN